MKYKIDWLFKKDIQKIFEIFLSKTSEFYVVGGSVRNSILSMTITDVDFATDLIPEKIIEIAKENNIKYIPLSLRHGTILIILNNKKYHVSSFRKDVLCDGRHALVKFTKNILEDAFRRDFTINSLYLTKDGNLIDPLNIIKDVQNRKIKFIGNPDLRIKEDYLRILRFFRFSEYYSKDNESFDEDSLNACKKNRKGLLKISKERIFEEFKKIILSQNIFRVLNEMHKIRVLEIIISDYDLSNLPILIKNEKKFFRNSNFLLRFLFLNFKNILFLDNQFPLKRHEKKIIKLFLNFLQKKISNKEIGYRFGIKLGFIFFTVKNSMLGKEVRKEDYNQIFFGSKQIFPITSEDLLSFYKPSNEIGKKKKFLESVWINSDYKFTKTDLLKKLN